MDLSTMSKNPVSGGASHRRLREACDYCHSSKVRCSGGKPCEKCRSCNLGCQYSYTAKLGKPKGSRNKKTLQKLEAAASSAVAQNELKTTPDLFSHGDTMEYFPQVGSGPSTSIEPKTSTIPDIFDASFLNVPHEDSLWAIDSLTHQPSDMSGATSRGDGNSDDGNFDSQSEHNYRTGKLTHFFPSSVLSGDLSYASAEIEKTENTRVGVVSEGIATSASRGTNYISCGCLKRLTEELCRLNIIERKQTTISLDTALSEMDMTISCAESVMECDSCRLDTKTMLLIMTLLQTVVNWVGIEYKQKAQSRELPPIRFGDWGLSTADGHLIKVLLTRRILAASETVISTLRLRIEEITLKASRHNMCYGLLDSESLQQTLRRLTMSLKELSQCTETQNL